MILKVLKWLLCRKCWIFRLHWIMKSNNAKLINQFRKDLNLKTEWYSQMWVNPRFFRRQKRQTFIELLVIDLLSYCGSMDRSFTINIKEGDDLIENWQEIAKWVFHYENIVQWVTIFIVKCQRYFQVWSVPKIMLKISINFLQSYDEKRHKK